MGLQPADLQQQLEQYNAAAAAGTDLFGKQYFPTTLDPVGHFWIGQITPVVHYCMGGLEINDSAQVGVISFVMFLLYHPFLIMPCFETMATVCGRIACVTPAVCRRRCE
jgi:succinate dehydrogenase/fumarate reductase flavoprotein subunit